METEKMLSELRTVSDETLENLRKIKSDLYPDYRFALTDIVTGEFILATKTLKQAFEELTGKMLMITDLERI